MTGLPAGSYVAIAKGNVGNFDHGALWDCGLYVDDATTGTQTLLDGMDAVTTAGDISADVQVGSIILEAVFTLANAGGVHMACGSQEPGSDVTDIKIIAVQR